MSEKDELWKWCPRCRQHKPRSKFSKDSYRRDGLTSRCKGCTNGETANWRRQNPEKYKAGYLYNARAYKVRQKYNISLEEYDDLRDAHDGLCHSCGQAPNRQLQMDFDRELNAPRGFVCELCKKRLINLTYAQAQDHLKALTDRRLTLWVVSSYVSRRRWEMLEEGADRKEMTE